MPTQATYIIVESADDDGPSHYRLVVECGAANEEACDDTIDEDLDGLTDCDDVDCLESGACQ